LLCISTAQLSGLPARGCLVDNDHVLAALHDARVSTDQTLEAIVHWAQKAVGASGAGVFLLTRRNGRAQTVLPTSPEVSKAHEIQLELGEGPCVDVLKPDSTGTCIVGDTSSDRRFPLWGRAAADLGLRSAMSAVMKTHEKCFGSLNVFSETPHQFELEDLAVLDIFSRRAARAMAIAEDRQGLLQALDTRKLIGQAQGILMERYGIDGDRAFAYLARLSQQRNIKLRKVAELIVVNRDVGSVLDPVDQTPVPTEGE
jgi:GAF domain-containing protein